MAAIGVTGVVGVVGWAVVPAGGDVAVGIRDLTAVCGCGSGL